MSQAPTSGMSNITCSSLCLSNCNHTMSLLSNSTNHMVNFSSCALKWVCRTLFVMFIWARFPSNQSSMLPYTTILLWAVLLCAGLLLYELQAPAG